MTSSDGFRLVVADWGDPKTGKSAFAFTFPGGGIDSDGNPDGAFHYVDLDFGGEAVMKKAVQAGKKIVRHEVGASDPFDIDELLDPKSHDRKLRACAKAYSESLRDCSNQGGGTVVFDTFTQVRQIIDSVKLEEVRQRRAKKGNQDTEEVKIFPFDYDEANSITSSFVRTVYQVPNVNLVLVHRSASIYDAQGRETTQTKLQGWREIPAAVDVVLQTKIIDGKFIGVIQDCRHDPSLAGMQLTNPDFAQLRALIS